MTRFVFLSFIFLGWAFFEVSGGTAFEPAPPERITVAKPKAAPVLAPASEEEVDISAALAAESHPLPPPVKVALVSAPAPTPAQERIALTPSPEELAKLAEAEADLADIREVRGSRVNMRSGPGTRFSVLATLTRGEKVEVLGEPDRGWAKLKVLETGRIGWMSVKLLRTVE